MRYGLISDVHGNLEALQVCLQRLAACEVERIVFLGDAVGYGASPNEVCDLIRPLAAASVLGNHDAAVVGRMDYSSYYEAARQALDWCRTQLSPANFAWLQRLPYTVREGDVMFCHGSPAAPQAFDYIYAKEQVQALLPQRAKLAPVTFIGHSHLTVSFCIRGEEIEQIHAAEIDCDSQAKTIITVGSVGQPRDRDPRACCGVFDTFTGVFAYHRLAYDVQAARQKILAAGLSPLFGDRLLVGM